MNQSQKFARGHSPARADRPDGFPSSSGRPAAHYQASKLKGNHWSTTRKFHDAGHHHRGCTYEQFLEVLAADKEALRNGMPHGRTPSRAYTRQRNNVKARGIEWKMSLWEWWGIWKDSGHFAERGPGYGYVMCRRGDVGPYEVGNVYIATAIQNSAEGSRALGTLPIGVRLRRGRYQVTHRRAHLGTFDTAEEAAAAYAKASNFTDDLLVRT